MKPRSFFLCGVLFLAATTQAQLLDATGDTLGPVAYRTEMGQTIDTDGDSVGDLLYYSEGHPVTVWIHETPAMTFSFRDQDTLYSVRMDFVGEGVDPGAVLSVIKETTDLSNYYLAHTGVGVEGVPAAGALWRQDLYPRISIQHYAGAYGPKMAFVMEPSAEPAQIQMLFSGQDSLAIDWQGAVRAYVGERFLRLEEAFAYQVINGSIVPVSWSPNYDLVNGGAQVFFEFGTYDDNHPLIFQIGPPPPLGGGGATSDWRTLLGSATGNGGGDSWGNAAVAAPDGDLLIAGNTIDQVFPANTGTVIHQGVWDIYYGRFDHAPGDPSDDAKRIYTTYFGGTGSDKPIVAHYASDDRLYIGGWTNSEDINLEPLLDPQDGSYWQGALKGDTDGLLLVVDPAQGNLLRSTYFGGEGDEMFTAVAEDVFGDLYFGGATSTATGTASGTCTAVATGLPLCDPGGTAYHQTSNAGGTDLFLLKLDPNFSMLNSTFYGGAADDLLFDMAYYQDPVGFNDRIVAVGRTEGSLPQGDPGDFWLPGLSGPTAFIATFTPDGTVKWMTNMHGTDRLEAAAMQPQTSRLVVSGTTLDASFTPVPTTTSCTAVSGALTICDPGNGAYHDDAVDGVDEYFAEFDVLTGEMLWSTVHGGSVFEHAGESAVEVYDAWQYHPFLIRRFSDLVIDADGSIFAMGIATQSLDHADGLLQTHPALTAFGLYNQPWYSDMGTGQTEILLKCFDIDRGRLWSSTFGSRFTHVDHLSDKAWRPGACDWGHSLVLVPGEALYCAGSSGGIQFDDACPYPGTSWCEPPVPYAAAADLSHGFAARLNLQEISIGVPDDLFLEALGLSCSPNPTGDHVRLSLGKRALAHEQVVLVDARGRLVLRARTDADGTLWLPSLGTGLYSVLWLGPDGSTPSSVRFIKH
ncbi:MAG: T9SS type A sorting domain-containing protein [Flavobacteriales bacterium]|nr:T9SS type A sorting domain-containing protein [Flavobacteriales bacterium]MBK9699954.1 T9SS type A sorting domain-containing protein [Flavobacteriales bacterium]